MLLDRIYLNMILVILYLSWSSDGKFFIFILINISRKKVTFMPFNSFFYKVKFWVEIYSLSLQRVET